MNNQLFFRQLMQKTGSLDFLDSFKQIHEQLSNNFMPDMLFPNLKPVFVALSVGEEKSQLQ